MKTKALIFATLFCPCFAFAAIANTKHNLGASGTGTNHLSSGSSEICVFCHTPHGANTNVKAPLWNKALPNNTYTVYTSSTMESPTGQPGGISLACLSCHDGTQAMDNVINGPGSGGYNSAGAAMVGAVWTGANQTGGKMTGIAELGTDLSNDHPIGIRYCGNASTGNNACTDVDFFSYTVAGIGGYVNRSGSTTGKDKTDMWLYNDGSNNLMVECASCHDPHTDNPTFLRTPNTASAVCLTCHNK